LNTTGLGYELHHWGSVSCRSIDENFSVRDRVQTGSGDDPVSDGCWG